MAPRSSSFTSSGRRRKRNVTCRAGRGAGENWAPLDAFFAGAIRKKYMAKGTTSFNRQKGPEPYTPLVLFVG